MIGRKTAYSAASLAVCGLIILMLASADTAASAVREGLDYVARSVIPAIFPFAVLSSMLSEIGLPQRIVRIFPFHRLLGLPECAAPAILCGLLGGFPVGAIASASLYERGLLTRGEASRLCAVTSNVSPAFLMSVVAGLFSSRVFGICLWAAQAFMSIGFGVLHRRFAGDPPALRRAEAARVRPLTAVFCSAVGSSAAACVTVAGYVAFFRVIATVISSHIPCSRGVLLLLLEFSSGVEYAAQIDSAAACALSVGFGGVSALMQILNYASACGISARATLVSKSASALVLAAVGFLASHLGVSSAPDAVGIAAFSPVFPAAYAVVTLSLTSLLSLLSAKKYFSDL